MSLATHLSARGMAPPARSYRCWGGFIVSDEPTFAPPSQLLPHSPPFLFLDEVLEINQEWGRFRWRFPGGDSHNFASRMFPELALIEALTQATAAWNAVAMPREAPEEGFLAAAERFVFQHSPRIGDDIELRVFRRKVFGGLALFRVEAHLGRELLCSGEVTVFRDGSSGELPRLPQDSRDYEGDAHLDRDE